MTAVSWICPHCERPVTVRDEDISSSEIYLTADTADGQRYIKTSVTVCPNPACKKFSLYIHVHSLAQAQGGGHTPGGELNNWRLIPPSAPKSFPAYIPKPILKDYTEAWLIVSLSPKASATLSRRCLQEIIRDFHEVAKGRLVEEIARIKDRIDPLTWQAIDAVRSIGSIGAHMEADINLIVDVDQGEAEELLRLIEMLLKEWYVNRHEREEQLNAVKQIKAEKDALNQKGAS